MTATQDTAATPFDVDDIVTFTPEAGGARVGLHYVVDSTDNGIDPANGKQMISLKRKTSGRWGYRLAYTCDLVKVY